MTVAYEEYIRDLQGLSHTAANLFIDCTRDDGLTAKERAIIRSELLLIAYVIRTSIETLNLIVDCSSDDLTAEERAIIRSELLRIMDVVRTSIDILQS